MEERNCKHYLIFIYNILNMEVHHHSHKPKNWKEYITEFFMLFLAVFAGFLAESYLEYRTERHKEHDYLASMVKDLQLDTADMNYKIKNMTMLIDTAEAISHVLTKKDITRHDAYRIYNDAIFLETKDCFLQFANGTIDQLRNAGGFRVILNKEINNKIKDYIVEQGRLSLQADLFRTEWTNSKHQKLNLLHTYIYISNWKDFNNLVIKVDETSLDQIKNSTGNYFLSSDRKDLIKYANSIRSQNGYLQVYKIITKSQIQKATELIKLIQEEIK